MLSTKRSLALLLTQCLIPVLFISITILLVRTWEGRDLPPLKLGLNTYSQTITTLKLHENVANGSIEKEIYEKYRSQFGKGSEVEETVDNIDDHYLKVTKESLIRTNTRRLYGASFAKNEITMHFNNRPYHATPISLGLIHNAILRAVTGNDKIGITVTNKPLPYRPETNIIISSTSNNLGFQLSFNVGFAMSFVASFFVIYYVKEKNSKVCNKIKNINQKLLNFKTFKKFKRRKKS